MRLRLRLAVTAAAVMLPVTLALFWFDAATQHRAAQQILIEYTLSRTSADRQGCEAAPERWGGALSPMDPPFREPPPRNKMEGQAPRGPPPDEPPQSRMEGPLPHGPPPDEGHGPPPRGAFPPPPSERRPRARPAVLFAYDEARRSANPAAPAMPAALAAEIAQGDVARTSFVWPTSEVEVLVRTPWGTGPCAFVLARGTTDPAWGAILPETQVWLLPVVAVLLAVLLAMGPVIRRIRRLTEAARRSASLSYASDVAIGGGDEIAELAAAFDAARREIRAQLEEKDRREKALRDFVANTTHDVMVPLAVLQGHLATLRERAAEGGPHDAAAVVSAMNEAHYMASLVHNLTAAARLQAAEVTLQPSRVDLGALVERVIGRHRPIARQLDVSLEIAVPDEPLIISADVTLIEQAVSNVTYNAVRYNHPGGHVALVLERDGASFTLRVIDDGPGIAAEALSRLVERGYRGDEARTRAPGGQGLGLHIAFRAAELHGFAMTLKPSEHGGLEVTLSGPAPPPDSG